MTPQSNSTDTLHAVLAAGASRLEATSTSPRLDAELLLAHVLKTDRLTLVVRAYEQLPASVVEAFHSLIAKRVTQVPVAQLVGHREFWRHTFEVTPDVLVPRPETELMIEHALSWIQAQRFDKKSKPLSVVDLGTGSGCIAISLDLELRAKGVPAEVLAVDQSPQALAVAQRNAERLGSSVKFFEGSWFAPLSAFSGTYDVVLTNPPYLRLAAVAAAPWLQHEPVEALASGSDGFHALRQIAQVLSQKLSPRSFFQCEIGETQGAEALAIFRKAVPEAHAEICTDGAGLHRFIRLTK